MFLGAAHMAERNGACREETSTSQEQEVQAEMAGAAIRSDCKGF